MWDPPALTSSLRSGCFFALAWIIVSGRVMRDCHTIVLNGLIRYVKLLLEHVVRNAGMGGIQGMIVGTEMVE